MKIRTVNPSSKIDPEYFHKVVDCQWACPAHTPVPEYIRLIAERRYTEAYLINWESNVFPAVLGRTCDRPCEPACRRTRTHEKPVAICRLKRVAADNKGDVDPYMPIIPPNFNGKRIALIGAGPASLTVARDLRPLGYECVIFDSGPKGGGMMRSQIPDFRLPEDVLDEEVERILDFGIETHFNTEITSLKSVLDQDFDAVFVGTGAPRGKDLDIPGRTEAAANIHIGIDWLMSVAFGHLDTIGKRVVVIGGGNTAMDCCRSALRLGGEEVTVTVRRGMKDMKASEWEIEETLLEGIPINDLMTPDRFELENGKLVAAVFKRTNTGEEVRIPCDDVLMAIGQENAFPWIEKDIGLEFDEWDMPVVDKTTFRSTHPKVFFGGDSAFGPENIIWAVAHGHQAALSIDMMCRGEDPIKERPANGFSLVSQKMGIHEWSYDNDINNITRRPVPHADQKIALRDITVEVELGYDEKLAKEEAERCLNCDVQTIFTDSLCIECDACVDICPMDCINFLTTGEDENELRGRLRIPASENEADQDLYVSSPLKTQRAMIKDEDLCLHCGLCAERCPTGAWDMRKSLYDVTHASSAVNEVNNAA